MRNDGHIGSDAERLLLESSAGRPFFTEAERRQVITALREASAEDRCDQ